MSRNIRIQDPDLIFHVTNRTIERMYLLVPDDVLNAIAMKWLRRAVRIYGIQLHAAVIMCNHFHLILSAPNMNLGQFMCYFTTNLSKDVNKLRERENTVVFPKRYSAEPILDIESLSRMLSYVLANPVAAHMVETPGEHPGYTSWHQSVGQPLPKRQTEAPPEITPPPHWSHLDDDELAREWEKLLRPRIAHLTKIRTGHVLGAERVRKLDWRTTPRDKEEIRARPRCHGRSREARQLYRSFQKQMTAEYQRAAEDWRGGLEATFPFGTRPPGWSRCDDRAPRKLPEQFRFHRRGAPPPHDAAA